MRQSLAGMTLVVAILALGLAALLRSTPLGAAAMTSATLGLLTIALIGTICRRGRKRSFWAGFAVAGWVSMFLHLGGGWFLPRIGQTLLSTAVFDILYEQISPGPPAVYDPSLVVFGGAPTSPEDFPGAWEAWASRDRIMGEPTRPLVGNSIAIQAPPASFQRSGACLAALLCAMIGGLVARGFTGPDREPTASP